MPGHRTGFFLIPRDGIGLFINGNSEFSLEEPFITEFLDRFYPSVVSPPEETVGRSGFHDSGDEVLGPLPGALSQYTGRFRHSWYPRTSMGKAVALTGIQGVERVVRLPGGDGRGILIDGNVYLPRAPDFFAEVSGDGIAGFWRSLKGEVVFLYEGGMNGYHRIRWYESVNLHRVAISLLAVIFGASLFAGVRSWVRGGQTRKDETVRPGLPARLTRCSAVMMSGLLTLFILGMALMAVTGVYRITQEVRWPLLGLLALPMLAGVALLGLLGGLAASWRDPALQSRERVSYVGLILCASLTFALMNYWMMLGYRF